MLRPQVPACFGFYYNESNTICPKMNLTRKVMAIYDTVATERLCNEMTVC